MAAALASALVTALVMYFVMRPEAADEVTPVHEPVGMESVVPSPSPTDHSVEPLADPAGPDSNPSLSTVPSPDVDASSPATIVPSTESTVVELVEPSTPVVVSEDPVESDESFWPELDERWVDVMATIAGPDELWILNGGPAGFSQYLADHVGAVDDWGCTVSAA